VNALKQSIQIPILNTPSTIEEYEDKIIESGDVLDTLMYQDCTYKIERYKESNDRDRITISSNKLITTFYLNSNGNITNISLFKKNDCIEKIIMKLNNENLITKYIVRNKKNNKDLFVANVKYIDETKIYISYEDVMDCNKIYEYKFNLIKYNMTLIEVKCENKHINFVYDDHNNLINIIKRENDIIRETVDFIDKDNIEKRKDGLIYKIDQKSNIINIYDEYKPSDIIKNITFNIERQTITETDYDNFIITTHNLPFIKEQGATKVVTIHSLSDNTLLSKIIYYFNGFNYKLQYEYEYEGYPSNYVEKFHNYNSKKETHRVNKYVYIDNKLYRQDVLMYNMKENDLDISNTFLISERSIVNRDNEKVLKKIDRKGDKTYISFINNPDNYIADELGDSGIDIYLDI